MTLSSRAKAFSVDCLLHSPSSFLETSETDSPGRFSQIGILENSLRKADRELTREKESSGGSSLEEGRVQQERDDRPDKDNVSSVDTAKVPESSVDAVPVTSCFCHGEMSFCMHAGVIHVTDRNGSGSAISAELLHSDLWFKFHRLGTEMIITKSGRRMFPSLKLRISGLDPLKIYETRLEFLQPDCKKYRYIYHSSRWMISGAGDALERTPSHVSPECPLTGQIISSQVLSFERLKLTNSEHSKPGQVSLVSMQKFQPRVVIEEVIGRERSSTKTECYQIVFPQTSFMAVTAYQNQQITTLKIASNPFAKGFRDSGKLRYPYDSKLFSPFHDPDSHIRLAYDTSRAFTPNGHSSPFNDPDSHVRLAYDTPRAFTPNGHSLLEAMENRLDRKRSHLHQWGFDHDEKSAKALRFDLFNIRTPLPYLLHPQFPVSPYMLPGFHPSPAQDQTTHQNVFSHDLHSLQRTITPRETDLTRPHSLSSFSSTPSSLSSSSSSLSSSSFSPSLTLRDFQPTPTACYNYSRSEDSELSPSKICSSSSSLKSLKSVNSLKNIPEKNEHNSNVKQEVDRYKDSYRNLEVQVDKNPQLQTKDAALFENKRNPTTFENLGEISQERPVIQTPNPVEHQHKNSIHGRKDPEIINPAHQACKNCTLCHNVYPPSIPNLNDSLKLIPCFYRHPLGIHGQHPTFTHQ